MLGELNKDIIGANPKYPPVNNLDYLTVDLEKYDNYPSDNNSVRIQPKLSELWNPQKNCGVNLIPNQTVQSLGMRLADEDIEEVKAEIVREAKKAMMIGLSGKKLAAHLRARFENKHLLAMKEEMEKLAEEQGLLGNVYIDASAFSSAKDAVQFLNKHRSRLARDFVINEKAANFEVMSFLASKFRKNVVSSVVYDNTLFNKYKVFLVGAGEIGNEYVIDSKESLRRAFLSPPPKQKIVNAKSEVVKAVSKEKMAEELINRGEKIEETSKQAVEELIFRNIFPILEYARKNIVQGKKGGNLKKMLRGKFASNDLQKACKYLAVIISSKILPEHMDKLVSLNKISKRIGKDMKSLLEKYPLKKDALVQNSNVEKNIGVQGYFHVLSDRATGTSFGEIDAAVASLRLGKSIEEVKEELLGKLSGEGKDKKSEQILLAAIKKFNESSAGLKANIFVPTPKKKIVADIEERQVLPDPQTIISQTQEIMSFYQGRELEVDVGKISYSPLLEIKGLEQKTGIDGVL